MKELEPSKDEELSHYQEFLEDDRSSLTLAGVLSALAYAGYRTMTKEEEPREALRNSREALEDKFHEVKDRASEICRFE